MDDEPRNPRDTDLERHADDARDSTWDDQEVGRHVIPGVVSGDFGPKGRVAAQLRDLSRRERRSYGQVPRGTTHGDGLRYLLLPMLGIAALLILVVVLLGWLLA